MLTVNMKNSMDDLLKDVRAEQGQIRAAASQALNTAARGYRTDASRLLRKRYPKLKNNDILDFVSIRFSSREQLQATIFVRGRPLTVGRFLSSAVTKRGKGGVYVNIKGQRKFIPHAWVRKGVNKDGDEYTLVWHRVSDNPRAPIEPVKTINLPDALNITELREAIEDFVIDRFDKEYGRQLARRDIRTFIG